jgi:hypothetical protein
MAKINTEILRQFEKQGFTINEGIAIDADLLNPPVAPSAMTILKNSEISIILLKESLIKMATP